MPIKTIRIQAKCSDLCNLQATDEKGHDAGAHDGYVPAWLPNPKVEHYGDYVDLTIDIETGKILN